MEDWPPFMRINHELPLLFDDKSKVMILGSFPSVKSREANFYYAHPSNRFWKVMEIIFEEEITDRPQFCLDHGIVLWDVIQSCEIHGSDDSSIKGVEYNDLSIVMDKADIKCIFTTGKKANDLYVKHYGNKYMHIALPSTSSANAGMSLQRLVEEYKVIREICESKE